MGPDVPGLLGDLPVVGPLFYGSLPVVALRLAGLVAVIVIGVALLKRLFRGAGSGMPSERTLIKQGRFEEVGDLCVRRGDHVAALRYYQKGEVWVKAGHSARRVGDQALAANLFQKGGALKLAYAAREAAGLNQEVPSRRSRRPARKSVRPHSASGSRASGASGMGEHPRVEPRTDPSRPRRATPADEARHTPRKLPSPAAPGVAGPRTDGVGAPPVPASRPNQAPAAGGAMTVQKQDALSIDADFNFVSFFSIKDSEPPPPPPPPPPPSRGLNPSSEMVLQSPLESVELLGQEVPAPVGAHRPSDLPPTVGIADTLPAVLIDATPGGPPGVIVIDPPLSGRKPSPVPPSEPTIPPQADEAPTSLAVPRKKKRLKRNSEISAAAFSRTVTDRYQIQEEIGEGGMAEVFKAVDLTLGRIVALKFLSPALMGNDTAMQYFKREARAAAVLNHPSIVTIYDIGVIDGRPFISMEFIDGTDLATRVYDEGVLQLSYAIDISIQIAKALDYAHERNLVHRDIKPANVMLVRGGGIKVLDFGLAKAIQTDRKRQSIVAGTPEYMSPEQLAGSEVDGRTDIFSFGVMLYEVLTNQLPYEGALRTRNVLPPSRHVTAIPPEVDLIVLRCVSLDQTDRYQRARDVARDLRAVQL